MRLRSLLIAILTMTMTAGCAWDYGMTAAKFPPASGPEGARVRLATATGTISGELLEVRADAFLLLTNQLVDGKQRDQVTLVPYARVQQLAFETSTQRGLPTWAPRDPESREEFRLISRFPQGLTPELLQQVLKMYGQTEVAGGKS